jgi:Cu(I)/Ag(I) efflux system membrane fusion protein
MKRALSLLFFVVALAAALAAGYWWGSQRGQIGAQHAQAPAADSSGKGAGKKILYYRNPMGLPDTSPVPKKDPMGMDYIPVYEGESEASNLPPGTVKIGIDKIQLLGVRTEAVEPRELHRTVHAVGTIQANERLLYKVAPRFEGWIEKLHVNTTGQPVARGQPLMEVYSPDLVTAQQEYFVALKGVEAVKDGSPEIRASMERLADSALQRLRNWEISDKELQALQQESAPRRLITYRSGASGIVLQKPSVQGMRFMPGEVLFEIADLSSVWMLADVFEQDIGQVRLGQEAKLQIAAYPDKVFSGKVVFIYPTIDAETRTAKLRIELPNPGGLLKPAMFANLELASGHPRRSALAVPDSAVLDSGARQVVLVRRGEGLFEPRTVKLGMRAEGYIEVMEGLQAGEQVVVRANFLIDAESNLKAALGTFGGQSDSGGAAGKPAADKPVATGGSQVHKATGTIAAVNAAAGTVKIEHDAIPSLKWPAMTMDFQAKDKLLLRDVKPGQSVEFDLAPGAPGEFVVERIAPARAKPAAKATPAQGGGR